MIGAIGLVWAAAWMFTVKSHHVRAPADVVHADTDTYLAIFRNRRFWISLIVVISINSTWRSIGFWLPKYLQDGKGYGETAMSFLSSGFFLAADLGSIAVGFSLSVWRLAASASWRQRDKRESSMRSGRPPRRILTALV